MVNTGIFGDESETTEPSFSALHEVYVESSDNSAELDFLK